MNIYEIIHPTPLGKNILPYKRLGISIRAYHQQPPAQPTPTPPTTVSPATTVSQPDATQQQQSQPQPAGTFQTLRLRDEPGTVTPQATPRSSRKRKSPATATQDPSSIQHPPPGSYAPPPGVHSIPPPPPPHGMLHPAHMGPPPPMPHGYQYVPGDYTPGGMPHPPLQAPPPQGGAIDPNAGRSLSQSKRAEQNRKAQRAFRERRDQHVKALESRSQLLDAALASADEANRRWEECRALVDQLRIENAALRAALQQAQMLNGNPPTNSSPVPPPTHPPEQPPHSPTQPQHPPSEGVDVPLSNNANSQNQESSNTS